MNTILVNKTLQNSPYMQDIGLLHGKTALSSPSMRKPVNRTNTYLSLKTKGHRRVLRSLHKSPAPRLALGNGLFSPVSFTDKFKYPPD